MTDNEENLPAQSETGTAPLPVSLRDARRALVAVESGANRVAILIRVESVVADWHKALGEPGRVAMTSLARHERELRRLVGDFRERTFTRRDRQHAWQQYRAAWDEINRQKEQASLAGKACFDKETAEILETLKNEGPQPALARLRKAQRDIRHYLLSKQHAEEIRAALTGVYEQIREEARLHSPAHRRLEERAGQARDFLFRVERAARRIESRIGDNRRQWETEGNALRAALLKQQIADDESDLERIREKMARVRKEVARLDKALEPRGRKQKQAAGDRREEPEA